MTKLLAAVDVSQVLATDYRSRADDKWLMLEVWRKKGLVLTGEQRAQFLADNMPSPETIRRTRQKFQEEGKYLPPKPVQEARHILGEEIRQTINQERLL